MARNGDKMIRKAFVFGGWVQGVGFRWRAQTAANTLGATGWVRNEWDGTVSMELQGTPEQIEGVVAAVSRGSYVRIERMRVKTIPFVEHETGFSIEQD